MLFLALGVLQAGAQAQDPDWQDKLSKRTYAEVKFRMHQVEMPDGIKLSAAIWTPDVEGEKFPVILIATAYNKLSDRHIR